MNIGTVSRTTLRKRLRDGLERAWAFPNVYIPSCTELNSEHWNHVYVHGVACHSKYEFSLRLTRMIIVNSIIHLLLYYYHYHYYHHYYYYYYYYYDDDDDNNYYD